MDITNFQKILPQSFAKGDIIPMQTTKPGHNNGVKIKEVSESTAQNFAGVFQAALQKVNDQQVHANQLTQQLVTDPKSVNVHSVLIASEKARMSLTFTKTIVDLAVKTYKELTNLR